MIFVIALPLRMFVARIPEDAMGRFRPFWNSCGKEKPCNVSDLVHTLVRKSVPESYWRLRGEDDCWRASRIRRSVLEDFVSDWRPLELFATILRTSSTNRCNGLAELPRCSQSLCVRELRDVVVIEKSSVEDTVDGEVLRGVP